MDQIERNNYALLIGIGKRPEDEDHMKITVDDAKFLSANIQKYCKFKKDDVNLLIEKKQTNKENILNQLEQLVDQTNSNNFTDLVIIYFSGHGIIFNDEFYFICNNTTNAKFPENAISGQQFLEGVKRIKANKLLFLIDSCHSNGINLKDTRKGTLLSSGKDLLILENKVIVTSSRNDEPSFTSTPLSLFTVALIRGLAGEYLREGESEVTLFQFFMYIRESVQNYSLNGQNPELDVVENSKTDNFSIVEYPNGKPKQKPFKRSALLAIKDATGRKVFENIKANTTDVFYRKQFDFLLNNFKNNIYPRVHFMSIEGMISTLPNKHIIKNGLTYFTKREKSDHKLIVKNLHENRLACLLGYPATGKSFSVIEISKEIRKKGYTPFYISMKSEIFHWDNIILEMIRHRDGNVFIFDDIHLNHSVAVKLYSLVKDKEFTELRILFVSRFFTPALKRETNLLTVLEPWTIEMEQPSMDEKITGIVRKFKKEFESNHPDRKYFVGALKKIFNKTHRNLIYLNEYLNVWEDHWEIKLSDINEPYLYKKIYDYYFLEERKRSLYLQYLCLYYFEIPFLPANEKTKTTLEFEKNNWIIREVNGYYTLHHGEFAQLLLRAYKANDELMIVSKDWNWIDFISRNIKKYIKGFKDNPPANFVKIFNSILYASINKEYALVKSPDKIVKSLLNDKTVLKIIKKNLNNFEYSRDLRYFLSSIAYSSTKNFTAIFKKMDALGKLTSFNFALRVYSLGMVNTNRSKLKDDFNYLLQYPLSKLLGMVENASLDNLTTPIISISKISNNKALNFYKEIPLETLVKKTIDAPIEKIGKSIKELSSVNKTKTLELYKEIPLETLVEKAIDAPFEKIGRSLNELSSVNETKTLDLYKEIPLEILVEKAIDAPFKKIGNSLNELSSVNEIKTLELYEEIPLEILVEKAIDAPFEKIGGSLNELSRVGNTKTFELYEKIPLGTLVAKAIDAPFEKIGGSLKELSSVNWAKTLKLSKEIPLEILVEKAIDAPFEKISKSLNELSRVNKAKNLELYKEIPLKTLVEKAIDAPFKKIGKSLNELFLVNETRTLELYKEIPLEILVKKAINASFKEIGTSLNELSSANKTRTLAIYENIPLTTLVEKAFDANYIDLCEGLSCFNAISNELAQATLEEMDVKHIISLSEHVNDVIFNTGLAQLRKVNLEKAKEIEDLRI